MEIARSTPRDVAKKIFNDERSDTEWALAVNALSREKENELVEMLLAQHSVVIHVEIVDAVRDIGLRWNVGTMTTGMCVKWKDDETDEGFPSRIIYKLAAYRHANEGARVSDDVFELGFTKDPANACHDVSILGFGRGVSSIPVARELALRYFSGRKVEETRSSKHAWQDAAALKAEVARLRRESEKEYESMLAALRERRLLTTRPPPLKLEITFDDRRTNATAPVPSGI
jgi:hypothetical protein